MALYDWMLLGHILSAMVWVGGALMLLFVAQRVRASTDPRAILDFGASLSYIGPRVLAPSVVGVLVLDVWMVQDSAA
jgi:putative copper export protein